MAASTDYVTPSRSSWSSLRVFIQAVKQLGGIVDLQFYYYQKSSRTHLVVPHM
jgi:hypothetical protein